MKKSIAKNYLILTIIITLGTSASGQQTYYNVTAGNGYGLRFWNSDDYKIHMGNTAEYKYGPVQDYSIKFNMYYSTSYPNRGWTWGTNGTTPVAALRTDGTFQLAKDLFVLGNVGIGLTAPAEELVVKNAGGAEYVQGVFMAGETGSGGIRLINDNSKIWEIQSVSANSSTATNGLIFYNRSNTMYVMTLGYNGQVAIGATSIPGGYLLGVNGKIAAKEVTVRTDFWSDFVLAPGFKLRPLSEVEQFVKQNQHLPGLPSEKEVLANGISLGEMNAKLLEKIEELTLYMIDLKKENAEQQKLIEDQQKLIESLLEK